MTMEVWVSVWTSAECEVDDEALEDALMVLNTLEVIVFVKTTTSVAVEAWALPEEGREVKIGVPAWPSWEETVVPCPMETMTVWVATWVTTMVDLEAGVSVEEVFSLEKELLMMGLVVAGYRLSIVTV